MASLNSVLTIKFDPEDRALLERVADALERANPERSLSFPFVPMDPSSVGAGDDEEDEETPPSLPCPEALQEIGNYLGLSVGPVFDPRPIVQAVKDLGSKCQDLTDALARKS